jgi:hypothetical protein
MGKINNPTRCHGFMYRAISMYIRTSMEYNSNILKNIISIKACVLRLMALYKPFLHQPRTPPMRLSYFKKNLTPEYNYIHFLHGQSL